MFLEVLIASNSSVYTVFDDMVRVARRIFLGLLFAFSPTRYGGVHLSTLNSVTNGCPGFPSSLGWSYGLEPATRTVPSSKRRATE